MVELAVRAGADVFMRDRRGRTAYDGLGKDDKVRVFLRQCKLYSAFVFSQLTSAVCSHEPGYLATRVAGPIGA